MVTDAGTPEGRLQATAHAALDAHAAALPDALAERLARARALALAELDAGGAAGVPAGRPSRVPRRWVPTFALAATLLVAVGVWDRTAGPVVSPLASSLPPLPALDDPHEARAVQDMELLDDLEFVAWMELQAETELDGGAAGEGAGASGLDASGVSHAG